MSLSSLARMGAPDAPAPHGPERMDDPVAPGGAAAAAPKPQQDGFDSLIKYIPTETVTIFVALCSARSALQAVIGAGDDRFLLRIIYAGCAVATPLILWVIAAGRYRMSGSIEPFRLHWWPLFAATVAFLVWALSVPGVTQILPAPSATADQLSSVAAMGAVLVSLILSMLEPLLGPRPAA